MLVDLIIQLFLKAVKWKANAGGAWGQGQSSPHQPLNGLGTGENYFEFIVESQQVWKDRSSCEPDIGKPLYVQTRIYNIRRVPLQKCK